MTRHQFLGTMAKLAGTYGNSINAYHGASMAAPGAAAGMSYGGRGALPALPVMRNQAAQQLKSFRAEGPAGVADARDARYDLTRDNTAKAMAMGGDKSHMWPGYSSQAPVKMGAIAPKIEAGIHGVHRALFSHLPRAVLYGALGSMAGAGLGGAIGAHSVPQHHDAHPDLPGFGGPHDQYAQGSGVHDLLSREAYSALGSRGAEMLDAKIDHAFGGHKPQILDDLIHRASETESIKELKDNTLKALTKIKIGDPNALLSSLGGAKGLSAQLPDQALETMRAARSGVATGADIGGALGVGKAIIDPITKNYYAAKDREDLARRIGNHMTEKGAGLSSVMKTLGKASVGVGALGLAGYAGMHHEGLLDKLHALAASRHPTLTATLNPENFKSDLAAAKEHAGAAAHETGRRLSGAWDALKGNRP